MAQPHSPPQSSPRSPAESPQPDDDDGAAYDAIGYDEEFTDSLMDTVLSPHSPALRESRGIRILAPDSTEEPIAGRTVRLEDIDYSSLPDVPVETLPLPLDDERRVYSSPVPGILLTHPGGWLEGGAGPSAYPGPSATTAEYTRAFIIRHNIRTPNQLHNHLRREMQHQREELRRRMQERRDAYEHNVRVDRDLQRLTLQRAMERRIEERKRSALKDKKTAAT